MTMARALYFSQKALGSIRESPWLSVITTTTIATALLVLGLYALALQNVEQLALVWGRTASVTVYVADDAPEARWEELRAALAKRAEVERAELVTPRAALARFRARGPEAAALVEGVDEAVLPASIALTLMPGAADLESLAALATELAAVSGVADVDYGREEFDRLSALLQVLRVGGLAGALLIALATAFIVSNTIRLTVYARRDEIGILGLVGATAWFIRVPFIIEGAVWGAAAGGVSVGLLWVLDRFAAPELSLAVADVLGGITVRLFAPGLALAMLGGGIVLGALASGLAVRRFLDVELR